ncbi:DUF6584 family protein [Streptomyces sp. NPDC048643]|uniref:DUF6584 family protein n=1 Tax=Streptomyces sp. NPDC048643 TaxID=3155637 RepID=UPI0034170472
MATSGRRGLAVVRCSSGTAAANGMKALAWHGPETTAGTAFAQAQLVAVRSACAENLGHTVDWDNPASYQDDLQEEYEPPSGPWTIGGVLAGVGCLALVLVLLAIWVNGLVALLD